MKIPDGIYYMKHKRKHSLLLIIDTQLKTIRIIRLKTKFISKANKTGKVHLKKNFISNTDKYKQVTYSYFKQKLLSKNISGVLPAIQQTLFSNQLSINLINHGK